MDPVYRFPASPGMPLFPVSPERVNRQPLPQSPSLPSNLSDPFLNGHAKAPSDVQGKVAQFNNLSKEAAQRRRDNEAALQRAVMGREEAENETRRLKEENRILRKDIEEGRGRERRVGERLEALMVSPSWPDTRSSCLRFLRKSCSELRRRMRIHKLCTRRKFEGLGRKLSRHQAHLSSCKRN